MITPFIGDRVHVYATGWTAAELQVEAGDTDPMLGIISKVFGNRMVNVFVFTKYGSMQMRSNVQLLQDSDEAPVLEDGLYAQWIPGTI